MSDIEDYVEHYGFEARRADEDEPDFRRRIAGELRAEGRVIEAHEVLQGRRYDDPDQGSLSVIDGVAGALLSALGEGPRLSAEPWRRMEEEAMLGALALAPPDPMREVIASALALGPGGVDLLLGQ
jgi:hypothetical protein